MPHARSGPRHHCPGLTGKVDNYPGNCRHNGLWCETHENYCPRHDWSHMKKWPCPACEKELRMNDRRKDKDRKRDDGDGDGGGDRKNNPKPINARNRKQIAKAARQDKQAGNKKPKTKNKSRTKDGSMDGSGNSQVKRRRYRVRIRFLEVIIELARPTDIAKFAKVNQQAQANWGKSV
ncbi:hypothetical protein HYALB_00010191 [Hymenoscyphus albidus]|uniref:Uncharacterized protein n=1 Tax=Hymenoscyphus albidus TaxID=595503 RepID=A0A9N9LJY0_9HELO|nr:hypothetical protein HYALB_00010191 [Hymenoscyphus albidus]